MCHRLSFSRNIQQPTRNVFPTYYHNVTVRSKVFRKPFCIATKNVTKKPAVLEKKYVGENLLSGVPGL